MAQKLEYFGNKTLVWDFSDTHHHTTKIYYYQTLSVREFAQHRTHLLGGHLLNA